jgi:EF-hand domain pair
MRTKFIEFDEDGSGQIDQTEFTAMLKSLNLEIPAETVQKIFKMIDQDGEEGTISYGEFWELVFPSDIGNVEEKEPAVNGSTKSDPDRELNRSRRRDSEFDRNRSRKHSLDRSRTRKEARAAAAAATANAAAAGGGAAVATGVGLNDETVVSDSTSGSTGTVAESSVSVSAPVTSVADEKEPRMEKTKSGVRFEDRPTSAAIS